MGMARKSFCGVLLWWGCAAGCGHRDADVTTAPPEKTAPAITTPHTGDQTTTVDTAVPGQPADPDPPPVAAIRTVLSEVEAGRLEALADFLPTSYQRDLETLARLLAARTPDDVWPQLHDVAIRLAALLEHQPQFVAQAAGGSAPVVDEEFQGKLSAALAPLTDAATWDRTRWQAFELRPFLKGPASSTHAAWNAVVPSQTAFLTRTKIRLISQSGDQATLELQAAVDDEPRPVEFVRIEEKWIPKSLADSWPSTVGRALTQLSNDSGDQSAEHSARLTERLGPLLAQIAGTLDPMLRAERPEELQLGWWQIQSLLIESRQAWLEPGPPPRVELRLAALLSETALSELLDHLVEATDTPVMAEYVTLPTASGLVIHLTPVRDVAAFVARLGSVTVKSHDAAMRTVEIEPKTERD